jgi:hypothetical protein
MACRHTIAHRAILVPPVVGEPRIERGSTFALRSTHRKGVESSWKDCALKMQAPSDGEVLMTSWPVSILIYCDPQVHLCLSSA